MPLNQGSGKASVSKNIKRLMSEGRPQKQAVAISLSVADRAKKGSKAKKGRSKAKSS